MNYGLSVSIDPSKKSNALLVEPLCTLEKGLQTTHIWSRSLVDLQLDTNPAVFILYVPANIDEIRRFLNPFHDGCGDLPVPRCIVTLEFTHAGVL